MKSTGKLIKKLNYDEEVTLTELRADKNILDQHRERLSKVFKNDTPQQIDRKITDLVVRDNAFAAIMNIVVKSFEFKIDDEDVNKTKELVKKTYPNFTDEQLRLISEQIVKRDLVFDELAKLWDISVSDEEVKRSLNDFYKLSNQSIREYLDDKERFESVRKMILYEKITKEMLSRFRYKLDLQKPKTAPKKEEQKQ